MHLSENYYRCANCITGTEAIRHELERLYDLDRNKDSFLTRPYSKRRARLIRMYLISKGE